MILKFDIFQPYHKQLIHGITKKSYGSFNNEDKNFEENLKKLSSELNIQKPIFANQVHKDTILIINKHPDTLIEADAFITQQKNLPLMIKTADCQGVLIYDPAANVIAAIHSGWRGSAKNIIGKTIEKMKNNFKSNPFDLLVGISPSLGPCCAEFSDPKNELPDFCNKYIQNKNINFWQISRDQCKTAGIPENQIEIAEICTKCNSDFYSYRKKDTGRMAVFIAMQ